MWKWTIKNKVFPSTQSAERRWIADKDFICQSVQWCEHRPQCVISASWPPPIADLSCILLIIVFEKRTRACFFQIALETMLLPVLMTLAIYSFISAMIEFSIWDKCSSLFHFRKILRCRGVSWHDTCKTLKCIYCFQ